MDATPRDEVLEGLNVFRALESWGAALYAAKHSGHPLSRNAIHDLATNRP